MGWAIPWVRLYLLNKESRNDHSCMGNHIAYATP